MGPTASGKTALALALAERLPRAIGCGPVEVVSADARQVYRLMDIATAKPTQAERAQVLHHVVDMVWPDQSYTLAQYQADAQGAIAAIQARNGLPLLVGGSGLYVRAVMDGLAIPVVEPRDELRAELEALAARSGAEALVQRLRTTDPLSAQRIDPRNVRRLIRAIEVSEVTGIPFSAQQGRRPTPYATPLILGLTTRRESLYGRADLRINRMLAEGLIAETRALLDRGYSASLPSMSSLGYREIGAYLRGEASLEDARARFEFATHAYIRRQLTWFRPDTRIAWLDCAEPPERLADAAIRLIAAALV
ncbi:MAG TPA: tRNA (adenosine(37)-N6)-dimethylallyltransferase MiaA [Ktedonobacterales bacterium]